mmetsp:Transcript_112055/g.222726  ORF Transcript_112055/g.222726 Transcript_112055/m.222726 type:complete len:226 (-) Transcript_112055:2613-3290(-)
MPTSMSSNVEKTLQRWPTAPVTERRTISPGQVDRRRHPAWAAFRAPRATSSLPCSILICVERFCNRRIMDNWGCSLLSSTALAASSTAARTKDSLCNCISKSQCSPTLLGSRPSLTASPSSCSRAATAYSSAALAKLASSCRCCSDLHPVACVNVCLLSRTPTLADALRQFVSSAMASLLLVPSTDIFVGGFDAKNARAFSISKPPPSSGIHSLMPSALMLSTHF